MRLAFGLRRPKHPVPGRDVAGLVTEVGSKVTGVASGGKADLVRALGATRVIDHTREDLDDGTRYDVVIDIAGLRPIRQLRRILTETGTLVIVGGEGGDRWLGGTHRQLAALALSPFVSQRLTALLSKENAGDLDTLAQLADEGRVRPALERTYALHEAAQAIDHVASGHARGKVAVSI